MEYQRKYKSKTDIQQWHHLLVFRSIIDSENADVARKVCRKSRKSISLFNTKEGYFRVKHP